MFSICKKELGQYFGSLTGYVAIIVFLVVNGLVLFVFENNIFDFGYASLSQYFDLAPWVLLFLIPAVTMRCFSEELKSGTYEVLATKPVGLLQLIMGKYLGNLIVAAIALLPTVVYYFSIQSLAYDHGIDAGAAIGAYIGLLCLAAVFTSIGIWASSLTKNTMVAFITAILSCTLLYFTFNAISKLSFFQNAAGYYVEMFGIDFHYKSISRGVIDTRDLIYFFSLIALFMVLTYKNLEKK